MTNAYCFHRFSTPAQDKGTSFERQALATSALCARKDWTMMPPIEDRGRSAWKGDHLKSGNLGKWRKLVDLGEIEPGSVLVVENLDRLSRQNARIARRWIEDLTDCGISIAVCTPELFLDAEAMNGDNIGAMVLHLLESIRANKESSRRSEHRPAVIAKQLEKARQGLAFTNRLPAYLHVVDGRVHAVEDRAAVIVKIYEWAVTMGYQGIATRLNATVAPWNGKKWNEGYVRDLLHSPIVEGEYRPTTGDRKPTGEVITGYYPVIVEPELVQQARAAIIKRDDDKTGGQNREEAKNLFSGVVECAECGGKMTRVVNNTRGVQYPYFICRNSRSGMCTSKTQFRYDHFETAALKEILHLALDNSHFVKTDDITPLVARVAANRKAVTAAEEAVAIALKLLKLFHDDEEKSPAIINDFKASEKAHADARKTLEASETELAIARGQVTPEEHMRRVIEVRHAITSDDADVRLEARRQVREAIGAVVHKVVCDRVWRDNLHADRRITLIMKGNHLGWLFDGEGNVLERHDFQAYADAPARSRDQAMSYLMRAETNDDLGETQKAFETISKRYARERA